ncbi:MAG: C39 family peptidase [Flavonifractor plautii]
MEGTASAIGLKAEAYEADSADALVQQLASGHLFVALMTRGHFTERGHFIILRGVTLEGRVLVADPNSRERSLAAWEPQTHFG